MAFKTPPKVQRAKRMEDYLSKGFYGRDLSKKLKEDFFIRKFLEERLPRLAVSGIEIERAPEKIEVKILSPRPALILGKKGSLLEKLKGELKRKVNIKEELILEVKETKTFWDNAQLVANWMAEQLEKRVPYKRVLKGALEKILQEKNVLGVRIQVSGRLDGVEIARKEWLGKGRLPRATIRSQIDFAKSDAKTKVGTVGVKVWIYKGEKFE